MKQISWRKFYGDKPITPIPIEKYFLDDGNTLSSRQMTYEFCSSDNKGMYPTFEINDLIIDNYGKGDVYFIFEFERGFQELHVELLDETLKRTGKTTYLDLNEVFHKLKGVEWI